MMEKEFPAMQSTGQLKKDVWNEAIEAAAKAVDASTMEFIDRHYKNAEDWFKVKASANVRALKR